MFCLGQPQVWFGSALHCLFCVQSWTAPSLTRFGWVLLYSLFCVLSWTAPSLAQFGWVLLYIVVSLSCLGQPQVWPSLVRFCSTLSFLCPAWDSPKFGQVWLGSVLHCRFCVPSWTAPSLVKFGWVLFYIVISVSCLGQPQVWLGSALHCLFCVLSWTAPSLAKW